MAISNKRHVIKEIIPAKVRLEEIESMEDSYAIIEKTIQGASECIQIGDFDGAKEFLTAFSGKLHSFLILQGVDTEKFDDIVLTLSNELNYKYRRVSSKKHECERLLREITKMLPSVGLHYGRIVEKEKITTSQAIYQIRQLSREIDRNANDLIANKISGGAMLGKLWMLQDLLECIEFGDSGEIEILGELRVYTIGQITEVKGLISSAAKEGFKKSFYETYKTLIKTVDNFLYSLDHPSFAKYLHGLVREAKLKEPKLEIDAESIAKILGSDEFQQIIGEEIRKGTRAELEKYIAENL